MESELENKHWTKIKIFETLGIFILMIIIGTAIASLLVALGRFKQVSKLDPDISLFNYKDPTLSHLYVYAVVIFSIPIFTVASIIVFGVGYGLISLIQFLIETITLKGIICFIIILVALSIFSTLVWLIISSGFSFDH